MRDFFRGWRRKTGCATLLAGMALLGIWMRALCHVEDEFQIFQLDETYYYVVLTDLGLCWKEQRWEGASYQRPGIWTTGDNTFPIDTNWHWWGLGTGIGEYQLLLNIESTTIVLATETYFVVSYWLLCLPLAMVSAWLILKNPGPKGLSNGSATMTAPSSEEEESFR